MQVNAQFFDHARVIAQCFVKLFLAGHQFCQIELAADFRRGIIKGHVMAAFGGNSCISQTRGACADNGYFLRVFCRLIFQKRFVAGARIDKA